MEEDDAYQKIPLYNFLEKLIPLTTARAQNAFQAANLVSRPTLFSKTPRFRSEPVFKVDVDLESPLPREKENEIRDQTLRKFISEHEIPPGYDVYASVDFQKGPFVHFSGQRASEEYLKGRLENGASPSHRLVVSIFADPPSPQPDVSEKTPLNGIWLNRIR
ncbi:MAG: hypothetical protein K9G62_08515 [Alphaproteobacteria bacterium]|nr:hypothetical protein [Alphaproteobacteria bacterium]